MKRTLIAGLLAIAASSALATVVDFNSGVPSGISLGGSMQWNGTGDGHLFMEDWSDNDFIFFSSPTTVNTFQMNREPWRGYTASPDDWLVKIEAFDISSNSLWTRTLDLSAYSDWSNWLTVNVGVDNVSSIAFYATGSWSPSNIGFWPSIDNMAIDQQVPEPVSLSLLGIGLVGLGLYRRRKD